MRVLLRAFLVATFLLLASASFSATEDWDCSNSGTITCDLTWTEQDPDFELASNKVNRNGGAFGSSALATTNGCTLGSNFRLVTVVQVSAGETQGLVWFYNDASNYYYAAASDQADSVFITKVVSGTPTQLCSNSRAIGTSSPFVIAVYVRGTKYRVYYNGIFQCEANDSAVTSVDTYGIVSIDDSGGGGASDGGTFDDYECENTNLALPLIRSGGSVGGRQMLNGGGLLN